MNNKDHEKLMRAGFSILRTDLSNLRIKVKSGCLSWKTLEKGFASQKALLQRFNQLLEHPKNIED